VSTLPTTPAEAAQLIADALNAAAQAGFSPRWDGEEGTVTCSRYVGSRWEYREISEDHEGVWGPHD
jgi:hypothetical protein